jgi:hypothetical protein
MIVLLELLPGFVLTLLTCVLIVGLSYYPSNRRNPEYAFTFISFSLLLYLIISLLRDVQLSLGFGFGLLAVFSTLHYRSTNIPAKEMTYLFVCITVPFMNSLFLVTRVTFTELIVLNLLVFVSVFALERLLGSPTERSRKVLYEKIELIKPESEKEMLADLRERTGLDIRRVEIEEIDFLRDTVEILVYYKHHQ